MCLRNVPLIVELAPFEIILYNLSCVIRGVHHRPLSVTLLEQILTNILALIKINKRTENSVGENTTIRILISDYIYACSIPIFRVPDSLKIAHSHATLRPNVLEITMMHVLLIK